MERLWSPWRHEYITRSTENSSEPRCIFCAAGAEPENDETNLVLYRGALNFVILNRYPYISGHLMIAPYAHLVDLDVASRGSSDAMMALAKRRQSALRD